MSQYENGDIFVSQEFLLQIIHNLLIVWQFVVD